MADFFQEVSLVQARLLKWLTSMLAGTQQRPGQRQRPNRSPAQYSSGWLVLLRNRRKRRPRRLPQARAGLALLPVLLLPHSQRLDGQCQCEALVFLVILTIQDRCQRGFPRAVRLVFELFSKALFEAFLSFELQATAFDPLLLSLVLNSDSALLRLTFFLRAKRYRHLTTVTSNESENENETQNIIMYDNSISMEDVTEILSGAVSFFPTCLDFLCPVSLYCF